MEIKTLEQYVITQLQDKDAEIRSLETSLRQTVTELNTVKQSYEKLLGHIKAISKSTSYNDTEYITFENLYKQYDADEYKYFSEVLGFENIEEDKTNE